MRFSSGVRGIALVKYIFSLVVALLMIFYSKNSAVTEANILIKIIGVAFACFGGVFGIKLGTIIRNWLMPDFVVTDGSIASAVKIRVFWAVGLQAIGCVVVAAFTATIYFKVAGPSKGTIYNDRVDEIALEARPYLDQWNKDHAQEIAANKLTIDKLYTNNSTAPDQYGNKPYDHNFTPDERTAISEAEEVRKQCLSVRLEDPDYTKKNVVCRHREYVFNDLKARGICQYGGVTDRPWFRCQ